jgi:hypothetical protein
MYNMFPWLGPWIKDRMSLKKNYADMKVDATERARGLKNPQMCGGFVDSFLIQRQSLEVL